MIAAWTLSDKQAANEELHFLFMYTLQYAMVVIHVKATHIFWLPRLELNQRPLTYQVSATTSELLGIIFVLL